MTFFEALLLRNVRYIAFDQKILFNGVELTRQRIVDMEHLRHSRIAQITFSFEELTSRQWYFCKDPPLSSADHLMKVVHEELAKTFKAIDDRKKVIADAHRRQREPKIRPKKSKKSA